MTWKQHIAQLFRIFGYDLTRYLPDRHPFAQLMQLEMSLVPLYDGSQTFEDLLRWMLERKFRLVGLQPGFADSRTGELLQVDGVFRAEA